MQLGNTKLDHWLYTAPLGDRRTCSGDARLHGYRLRPRPSMGGLVGSGKAMAVSTWTLARRLDGVEPAAEPSSRRRPAHDRHRAGRDPLRVGRRRPHRGPPDSDVAFGRGLLRRSSPDERRDLLDDGTLLSDDSAAPDRSEHARAYQLALSGNELVVLTDGLYEPNGPAWVTLSVYDWTTGTLRHTWPVAIPLYPGEVSFAVHGSTRCRRRPVQAPPRRPGHRQGRHDRPLQPHREPTGARRARPRLRAQPSLPWAREARLRADGEAARRWRARAPPRPRASRGRGRSPRR